MVESQIERSPVTGITLMMQQDSAGWQLIGLFPETGPPQGAARRRLVRDDGDTRLYQWQGLSLRLLPDQGDDYIYNLTSPRPMLFVICKSGEDGRPIPLRITADQDDCVAAVAKAWPQGALTHLAPEAVTKMELKESEVDIDAGSSWR